MPCDQLADGAWTLKPEPLRDVDITSTRLYGANSLHGLRRSNEDKRRAVMRLLEDSVWSGWSDGEVARRCGVSQPFVSSLRRSHTQNDFEYSHRTFIHHKTGRPVAMDTARIGRRRIRPPALKTAAAG
ncbi:hypothetical protein CHELA20_50910 [Hyphomicrobiales bacterium]|nr:hypothetical protein CHELA20_50910 [Hyphomicrobiales bacterium]